MTETIYAAFENESGARNAEAELVGGGISEANIKFEPVELRLTVLAEIDEAIKVRTIIEKHGGRTEVDNIADAGTIVQDPLEYSDPS
jgi:hypothetical protein